MPKLNTTSKDAASLFFKFFDKYRRNFNSNVECIKAFLRQNPKIYYKQEVFAKYLRIRSILEKELENYIVSDNMDSIPQASKVTKSPEVIEENIITYQEDKNTCFFEGKTQKPITSLEEALIFFEVDTDIWEVVNWKCKSWDTSMKVDEIIDGLVVTKPIKKTNYLVNVNLKRKEKELDYEKVKIHLNDFIINSSPIKTRGSKIGVLTLADIHTGLETNKLTEHTQEFNTRKLLQYLEEVSLIINSFNYEKVYLNILGDIVESVTGYNKIETLKEMEKGLQGGNLIIAAYEILNKFALSINNLEEINMISGNHDRLTPEKPMDKDGGAAQLVAYMLGKTIKTNWHPVILKRVIDNICYLLTHGDHKFVKQDIGKIVFEYGDQSLYNVILSGHWHIRKSTKLFQEKNTILVDTNKYRAITVAPIVTGNRWTEENGWSCSPGITITEAANDKKNINVYDIALSR